MQLGSCAEHGSEGRLRDKLRRPLSMLTWPRRVNGIEKSGKVRSEKLESPLSEPGQVWGAVVGMGNRSSLMWAHIPVFANLIAERLEEQPFPLDPSSNCSDSDVPKIDYGTTILSWVKCLKLDMEGKIERWRIRKTVRQGPHSRTTLQKALPPTVIKCSVACWVWGMYLQPGWSGNWGRRISSTEDLKAILDIGALFSCKKMLLYSKL